jgi:hypothetical protein
MKEEVSSGRKKKEKEAADGQQHITISLSPE